MLLIPALVSCDYATAKKHHDAANYTRAFNGFKRLAKQGDKRAQYYVGRMFHLGEGIPQDKREAVRWYRLSAEQGFARAENNLGILMLEQGNKAEAIKLFEKAAAQSLPQGKINLKAGLQHKLSTAQGRVDLIKQPSTSKQNQFDPSMEFRFNRFREGLK